MLKRMPVKGDILRFEDKTRKVMGTLPIANGTYGLVNLIFKSELKIDGNDYYRRDPHEHLDYLATSSWASMQDSNWHIEEKSEKIPNVAYFTSGGGTLFDAVKEIAQVLNKLVDEYNKNQEELKNESTN